MSDSYGEFLDKFSTAIVEHPELAILFKKHAAKTLSENPGAPSFHRRYSRSAFLTLVGTTFELLAERRFILNLLGKASGKIGGGKANVRLPESSVVSLFLGKCKVVERNAHTKEVRGANTFFPVLLLTASRIDHEGIRLWWDETFKLGNIALLNFEPPPEQMVVFQDRSEIEVARGKLEKYHNNETAPFEIMEPSQLHKKQMGNSSSNQELLIDRASLLNAYEQAKGLARFWRELPSDRRVRVVDAIIFLVTNGIIRYNTAALQMTSIAESVGEQPFGSEINKDPGRSLQTHLRNIRRGRAYRKLPTIIVWLRCYHSKICVKILDDAFGPANWTLNEISVHKEKQAKPRIVKLAAP